MAGSGFIILGLVSLVGLGIWSMIYVTFASHYFLTTLTESSAGHDEVQYPKESVIEWWWKPLFCLWVLFAWLIPISVVCAPLITFGPIAFAVPWFVLLWFIVPLSFLSVLHAQNWFYFMHPVVVWRAWRHWRAYLYVNGITLLSGSVCAVVLVAMFTHHLLWGLLAMVLIPTSLLFFARNWGRFAWLCLNFAPAGKKMPRVRKASDDIPEMDVKEIDPADEGIRPGLPAGFSTGYRDSTPTPPPPPDEDWSTDKKPYPLLEDGALPSFEELDDIPIMPAVAQSTSPTAAVEEEDEWATEKKPYPMIGDANFSATLAIDPSDTRAERDRPISLGKHFDDQHQQEVAKKRKAKEQAGAIGLPPASRKTPTFAKAMFFGVWEFMIYGQTLTVWANLIALTLIELFFAWMAVKFFPVVPD